MGNLKDSDFDEIWNGRQANIMREKVKKCKKNCWVTGTAVPTMRRKFWIPIYWVLNNKNKIGSWKRA